MAEATNLIEPELGQTNYDIDDPTAGVSLNLNAEQWEELQRMLNEPFVENPRLRRLLTEPGVCG